MGIDSVEVNVADREDAFVQHHEHEEPREQAVSAEPERETEKAEVALPPCPSTLKKAAGCASSAAGESGGAQAARFIEAAARAWSSSSSSSSAADSGAKRESPEAGADEARWLSVTDRSGRLALVSHGFYVATGYAENEVVGRTSSFLQGPATCRAALGILRRELAAGRAVRVGVVNYARSGRPFWNVMVVWPASDAATGALVGYVGAHRAVPVVASLPPRSARLPALAWTGDLPRASEHAVRETARIRRRQELLEDEAGARAAAVAAAEKKQQKKQKKQQQQHVDAEVPDVPLPREHVSFVAETDLPTAQGTYRVTVFRDARTGLDIVCTSHGDLRGLERAAVRVHDACFTSEVLGSLKCDCAHQLRHAMDYVRDHGPGVVVYLQQEGRGIGLAAKIKAYSAQGLLGLDTVDANRVLGLADDLRQYDVVPLVLEQLGVRSVRLITNNPRKIRILRRLGVRVVGRVSADPGLGRGQHSERYLDTKRDRMSHTL